MKGNSCYAYDLTISVIVPVYNAAFYLNKCVRSILRQTYTHLEIVLVDDGSTDRSGEICDRYAAKDSRVKVIHKSNGGVSSARNAGLDAASGKYVTFVDADDWLSQKAVKVMLQAMTSRRADISVGMTVTEGVCSRLFTGYRHDGFIRLDDTEKLCGYIDVVKEFPGLWGKLMRKDIITENNLRFDENISYGEDTLFIWEYLRCCKVISTSSDVVYHYSKVVENNLTDKTYADKSIWIFQCFQALWELFSEKQRQEQRVKTLLLEKAAASIAGSCKPFCAGYEHDEAIGNIKRIAAYYAPYLAIIYDTSKCSESNNSAVCVKYILSHDYEAVYHYFSGISHPRKRRIRRMLAAVKRWYVYRLCI